MKRYNGKPRGYVNHGGASTEKDRERLRKLGKNYNSIDFAMTDKMNESNYSDRSIPIGYAIFLNFMVLKFSTDLI